MEKAALALGGLSRELDADDVFIRKLANSSEFVVCDALSVFIRMILWVMHFGTYL